MTNHLSQNFVGCCDSKSCITTATNIYPKSTKAPKSMLKRLPGNLDRDIWRSFNSYMQCHLGSEPIPKATGVTQGKIPDRASSPITGHTFIHTDNLVTVIHLSVFLGCGETLNTQKQRNPMTTWDFLWTCKPLIQSQRERAHLRRVRQHCQPQHHCATPKSQQKQKDSFIFSGLLAGFCSQTTVLCFIHSHWHKLDQIYP